MGRPRLGGRSGDYSQRAPPPVKAKANDDDPGRTLSCSLIAENLSLGQQTSRTAPHVDAQRGAPALTREILHSAGAVLRCYGHGAGTVPAPLITQNVPGLKSMVCVGDDLYAPTFFDGTVIRIQRETGHAETVATGRVLASAVHTAHGGSLVALQDALPARLLKVDLAAGRLVELVRLGAMVPDNGYGSFYVTDFFDAGVVVVAPDGSTRRFEL